MTIEVKETNKGYDLPVSRREEDFFDRWRLASELWQIAGKAPKDWSVRVGVYGRWGEGKTSVLKFLEQFAKCDGDIVAWFNPWSIRNRDDLWNGFAGAIFGRLEEEGIRVTGSGAVKIKKAGRIFVDPIQKASELNQTAKVIVGGALSLFGKLLNADSDTFKQIRAGLGDRRLIVIIDDLDRAEPKLLPELFLSLREVLDLPGFSFVLAFDVDVVARALAEEYKAWGKGEEFLEKIIDFPIALPVPSDQQLRKFLFTQLVKECPFVKYSALEDLFQLLPKNPRKLKLFVRHLWTLRNQISRHDDWELDWPTLFIWQLLKIESAKFCTVFMGDSDIFSELIKWRFRRELAKTNEENREDDAVRKKVRFVLSVSKIVGDDPRADRIEKLIEALAQKTNANDPGHLRYQFHTIDRPHAITWKEFNEAFSLWVKTRDLKPIDSWIRQHSAVQAAEFPQTAQELFDTAVQHRRKKLDDAASAIGEDHYESHMRVSSDALELLKALVQESLPCVGREFFRNARNFAALLSMTEPWLHFEKNRSDQIARSQEREALLGFVKLATKEPTTFLAVLRPWAKNRVGIGEHSKLYDQLIQELSGEIEPFVADHILKRFSE
ncbi:MAG: KAP family NTPase, partial [Deltaproteobacteria bacterium]|nr:KAP family NTPase [Deltaproteobacteria bacterium]